MIALACIIENIVILMRPRARVFFPHDNMRDPTPTKSEPSYVTYVHTSKITVCDHVRLLASPKSMYVGSSTAARQLCVDNYGRGAAA